MTSTASSAVVLVPPEPSQEGQLRIMSWDTIMAVISSYRTIDNVEQNSKSTQCDPVPSAETKKTCDADMQTELESTPSVNKSKEANQNLHNKHSQACEGDKNSDGKMKNKAKTVEMLNTGNDVNMVQTGVIHPIPRVTKDCDETTSHTGTLSIEESRKLMIKQSEEFKGIEFKGIEFKALRDHLSSQLKYIRTHSETISSSELSGRLDILLGSVQCLGEQDVEEIIESDEIAITELSNRYSSNGSAGHKRRYENESQSYNTHSQNQTRNSDQKRHLSQGDSQRSYDHPTQISPQPTHSPRALRRSESPTDRHNADAYYQSHHQGSEHRNRHGIRHESNSSHRNGESRRPRKDFPSPEQKSEKRNRYDTELEFASIRRYDDSRRPRKDYPSPSRRSSIHRNDESRSSRLNYQSKSPQRDSRRRLSKEVSSRDPRINRRTQIPDRRWPDKPPQAGPNYVIQRQYE